jgi:NMD protein affecting ribosome stability and mRNA decay
MARRLFPERRICCACGASASTPKRLDGEPNIVAVTLGLYRRGNGKGQIKAAGSVTICEECLIRARVSRRAWMRRVNKEAEAFALAALERVAGCYSGLLSEDSAG